MTEYCKSVVFSGNSPTTEVYFTFDLDVIATHLHGSHYNEYQQFLYETISGLRAKHWLFSKIVDWLNENGYSTLRGKRFFNNHVHSILKKKRLRDERLNQEVEREYKNFDLWFIERKLINSV